MISEYAGVLAAFREPRLWPVGARKQKDPKISDEASQQGLRARALAAFSTTKLAEWQASLESEACKLVDSLPAGRPVDVIREFAAPWCLRVAELVTGADPSRREQLRALACEISDAAAEPLDDDLRSRALRASAELERSFGDSDVPMAAATFVALSRTLACLLANGWLALARHPAELANLRASPELMPRAIEEMLRYAGIPQAVFRRASQNMDLCGLRIAAGGRVILRLASANRDPERFPDPERFDCRRRASAQLSLGFGPHSCVGASLIRMAAAAATRAFVSGFPEAEVCGPIVWVGGSGFRSPQTLHFKRACDRTVST